MSCSRTQHRDACGDQTQDLFIQSDQGFFRVSRAKIRPHSQCNLGDFFPQSEQNNSQSKLKIFFNSSIHYEIQPIMLNFDYKLSFNGSKLITLISYVTLENIINFERFGNLKNSGFLSLIFPIRKAQWPLPKYIPADAVRHRDPVYQKLDKTSSMYAAYWHTAAPPFLSIIHRKAMGEMPTGMTVDTILL